MCMEPLTNDATRDFSCGLHVVCRTCSAELFTRGYHACPTCRAPRIGYTQARVNAENDARVRNDQQLAQLRSNGWYTTGRGTVPMLFFANEANGNPASVLVNFAHTDARSWDASVGTPSNSGTFGDIRTALSVARSMSDSAFSDEHASGRGRGRGRGRNRSRGGAVRTRALSERAADEVDEEGEIENSYV